jgi:hypothetical protein
MAMASTEIDGLRNVVEGSSSPFKGLDEAASESTVYVCSNCKTAIQPVFPQGHDDDYAFRCPGTDPRCSPREGRELLTEEQVEAVSLGSLLTLGK